jgi:DNA-binding MarR family transcriptional regulator
MNKTNLVSSISDGLDRIGAVSRSDDWIAASATDLTPTQASILNYLGRRAPARLRQVAAHLGVSLPTASASIDALVRKGLVTRRKDATDARARALALTASGRKMLARLARYSSRLRSVLSTMPAQEQADLFLHIVKIVRGLQIAGAIPMQRLCVTCGHFRAFAHPEGVAQHHCALVNVAIGNRDLRLDCNEHQEAAPADQTAIWKAIDGSDAAATQMGARKEVR